ncbi:GNAT family N-acetyltransferase [Fodinibius salsisoli]|uniref:Peptidoglycan bridge formation glycyltransferase FemA/FemB family protein n=1 Tax=Fodinibius salsisoli TaxID=2820877 RepID=A0ABT3PTG8_9BACT|nr:GNAT family N-acetyltransferase [Fodinibius salsisoli]MCW9709124.1 peptidoglycan bridge formation glycyltransferase FemA/FemB family protein [Fodinibius salsisoli]
MRIEKLQANNQEDWNTFVDHYPGQPTIAHNPSLGSIIEKTFKFNDKSVLLYDDETVIGIFPCCQVGNTIVSMPHFSYGGCFLSEEYDKDEVYREIFSYFDAEFEIRSFHGISDDLVEETNSKKISAFLNLQDSEDEQMEFFDGDKRTEVRKGRKEGIETEIGGVELLDEFYTVYSDIMHRLGSPVLTRSLFSNILEDYEFGEAKLFINYYEDKPVSSSIIMTYKNFVEVPWAASLWEYSKFGANNFLYWKMIAYSINQGYDIFSFGRATEGSGSHRFKKQWGTEDKQLYFNYSNPSDMNVKNMDFLADIWAKIPKSIADKIGPFFSKRVY